MFQKACSWVFFLFILAGTTGCDGLRNTFGLDHYQPDEFKVSDNPPLSVPKDYRLRPPVEGVAAPGGTSGAEQAQAQKVLFGQEVTPKIATGTPGEKILLTRANEQQAAAPGIRETVDKEAAVDSSLAASLGQKITSMKAEVSRNAGSIVNAPAADDSSAKNAAS
ncbi:MAG: DUF3035 domain-containing protein [Alphaproteobacteria bacterium]|nr:DUF3035 domain-containing protein [Alphaproteobacteria bacterium]